MKKKLTALFLSLVITCSLQAQLLWKISGNQLEKPSYIIGTHHLAPFSILDSIPSIQKVLKETEQVYGEIKMKEMQSAEALQSLQKNILIQSDTTLQVLFAPEEYDMIRTFCQEHLLLDINQYAKLKPAYLLNNIAVALYVKKVGNFKKQEQLDSFFQDQAYTTQKQVGSLETLDFQFKLLFNTPLKRQAELLLATIKHIDDGVEMLKEVTEAYMQQDLNRMHQINSTRYHDLRDPLPGEEEAVLDHRNQAWAEKMPSIMQTGSTLFAVGALHLPGKVGLLQLLKNKGYTVEPLN